MLALAPTLAHADESARIEGGRIVLSSPIAFESHGGMLLPTDAPILDAIATLLRAHPTMTLEIGAHTDARGADTYNMTMTEHVAREVRMALIARGIAAARLVAHGYGETQPIDDNRTEAGRAHNRRVELVILHP